MGDTFSSVCSNDVNCSHIIDPIASHRRSRKVRTGKDHMHQVSEMATDTCAATESDELNLVRATELGQFLIKKMNKLTLDRLWKHLDVDESGQIDRTRVLTVLQWMSVLCAAFRFRQQDGQGEPQIDKRKMKAQFVQVKDWILENKMNTKSVVPREEFTQTFGTWLIEYGAAVRELRRENVKKLVGGFVREFEFEAHHALSSIVPDGIQRIISEFQLEPTGNVLGWL